MLLFSSSRTLWFWTFYLWLRLSVLPTPGWPPESPWAEWELTKMNENGLNKMVIYLFFMEKESSDALCRKHDASEFLMALHFSMLLILHSPFCVSWKPSLQNQSGGGKKWICLSLILLPQKSILLNVSYKLQLVKWLTGATGKNL